MNRQITRLAQSVGIALRHNLERQADSFDGARIGNSGFLPDADKSLGATTVNFATSRVGGALAHPIGEYRRQPLVSSIIGKAFRWQFGSRMIGLHCDNVATGFGKYGRKMSASASLFECASKIDGAIRTDRLQHYNPLGIGFPTAAIVAVTNECRDRQSNPRLGLETLRLQPEIMRSGRGGDKNEREFSQNEAHGGRSPFDFLCSRVIKGEAGGLSISNWGRLRTAACALLFTALLTTFAVPAHAHEEAGAAGGVVAGFSHPFLGADHMLAMIAVGIWGAFLGRPLLVLLPMVFPVMMTVGAALAMASIPFPPVELGIAISVIALGLLILAAVRAVPAIACSLIAIFALFHGYAHGTELPETADPVGYSVGFVLATGLLHLAGIGLGLLKNLRFGELGLRAAGAVIAAAGVMFLTAGLPL